MSNWIKYIFKINLSNLKGTSFKKSHKEASLYKQAQREDIYVMAI
jgi:hypothetical protein